MKCRACRIHPVSLEGELPAVLEAEAALTPVPSATRTTYRFDRHGSHNSLVISVTTCGSVKCHDLRVGMIWKAAERRGNPDRERVREG